MSIGSMTDAKIILITGANKGLGLAAARELGRAGHTVLLGARDLSRGRAAEADLRGEGLDAVHVRLDVTDPAAIDAAAAWIGSAYGHLDILVNNAGISRDRPHGPADLPVAALREIYEVNVLGVVAVTNAMLPLLRRSPAPYIGNVTSGLGTVALLTDQESPWRAYAGLLGYNSSKAALNAVTLIYAATLEPDGIRVNGLSPGFCATDLNGHRGHDTAAAGGARIARQVTLPEPVPTGVLLTEDGTGTYPW
jgi:NAD(P)-dependent dehydrogenase (short-subunit alcohol dehydrogenase family)